MYFTLFSSSGSSQWRFLKVGWLALEHCMSDTLPYKCSCLQLEHKKLWRIIKSVLPLCGTGNKSLICTATGFFVSQHRWWSIPSFIFHANLVFQEKTSNLCEPCILKSVDLWTLVFPVCQCTKLYLIHEHFQHPIYAHFFVAAMLLNNFPSPYICWSWPVFSRQWLKIKNTRWRFLSKDKPRHHYTIIARKKHWTVDCMNSAFTQKPSSL